MPQGHDEGPPGPHPSDHLRTERTADGSLTLRDGRIDQTYGSGHGALAEARHVFLGTGGVAERLSAGQATRVLEVGLGTGLNLLTTADAAVAGGASLQYRALETRPPPAHLLRELDYGRHLRHPELAEAWIRLREDMDGDLIRPYGPAGRAGASFPSAPHARRWTPPPGALARGVTLEVALGDASTAPTLEEPGWADAIYHDAFSPDAAPALWSEAFLTRLASALAPGGVLVSYSVKGEVRRRLAAAGLRVEKVPGPPGGKRETLRAFR